MSDTPRTDALMSDMNEGWPDRWAESHAQLERELAEAKAEIQFNCDLSAKIDHLQSYIHKLDEAVEKERERCAKVCEEFYSVEGVAQKCAEAIRKGE